MFEFFHLSNLSYKKIPFFNDTIPAGFPSPAEDHVDKRLDLNDLLIKNPTATFFVRVQGDSMEDAKISSGDILVIDRSIEPQNGAIIVAFLDGEFTVKRFLKKAGKIILMPENQNYSEIEVTQERDFQVWGIVTYIIHSVK